MVLWSLTFKLWLLTKFWTDFKKHIIYLYRAFFAVNSSRWQHKYSSLNLKQECEWKCGWELLFLKQLFSPSAVQLQLYCMILKLKNIFISKSACQWHELLEVTYTKKRYIEKICSEQLCNNFCFSKGITWRALSQSLIIFLRVRVIKLSFRQFVLGSATVLKLLNPTKFSYTS